MMTEEGIQKLKSQLKAELDQLNEGLDNHYGLQDFHWGNTGKIYATEQQIKIIEGKLEVIERILVG